MAAFIGALSGLLIGPTTTVFYDSGFLIGLKGFVAAVFAGLASYPLALVGALGVGLLESFGSFWASAFKEVIVFATILPVLLWRSLRDPHSRGRTERMKATRTLLFAAFALLMLVLPLLPVPDFWITQLNLHRPVRPRGARAWCCSPASAGSRRSARPPSSASAPTAPRLPGTQFALSPWLALLLGVGLAVAAALVLGAITLRMSGHYLPLATIAWGLALNYTMANMEWLGKYDGLLGIPSLTVFGISLGTTAAACTC